MQQHLSFQANFYSTNVFSITLHGNAYNYAARAVYDIKSQ